MIRRSCRVARFSAAHGCGKHRPAILVGVFTLDQLTIHPFPGGNGCIAGALTNALLQDAGYDVITHVSLETSIAKSDDAFDGALVTSNRWHEAKRESWPWLRYFVGPGAQSYDQMGSLMDTQRSGPQQAGAERVRDHVVHHAPGPFTFGGRAQTSPIRWRPAP